MQQSATSGEGQWRRLLKTMFTPLVVHQMEVGAQLTAQQHTGLLRVEQLEMQLNHSSNRRVYGSIMFKLLKNNTTHVVWRHVCIKPNNLFPRRQNCWYRICPVLLCSCQTAQIMWLLSSWSNLKLQRLPFQCPVTHITQHTHSLSLPQSLTSRPVSSPLSASITIT